MSLIDRLLPFTPLILGMIVGGCVMGAWLLSLRKYSGVAYAREHRHALTMHFMTNCNTREVQALTVFMFETYNLSQSDLDVLQGVRDRTGGYIGGILDRALVDADALIKRGKDA